MTAAPQTACLPRHLRRIEALGAARAIVRQARLGKVRVRGDGRVYVDFGSRIKRFWSHPARGERFTRETAHGFLDFIENEVAEEWTRQRALQPTDQTALREALHAVLRRYFPKGLSPDAIERHLARWVAHMEELCRAGERSPTYLEVLHGYCRTEGHLGYWWGHDLTELGSYAAVEDFSLWLAQERGLGPKTRRNVLGVLRSFISWLERRHEWFRGPRQWPDVTVPEHTPAILSENAQATVLAAIPEARRGIFLAMALLALRPGEARALDAADVQDGRLMVSKAVKGRLASAPVRATKTGRWRRLPLDALAPELSAWIAAHVPPEARLQRQPLFVHPETGGRWSAQALRREWDTACRAAGVRVPMYEGTKHTRATAWAERGVEDRAIQALLGHTDLKSTARYRRLSESAVVDAVRKGG